MGGSEREDGCQRGSVEKRQAFKRPHLYMQSLCSGLEHLLMVYPVLARFQKASSKQGASRVDTGEYKADHSIGQTAVVQCRKWTLETKVVVRCSAGSFGRSTDAE